VTTRRRTLTVRCGETACPQTNHYDYSTNAEYASATKRSANWKCTRHANPDQVLCPDNPQTTAILTATTLHTQPDRYTGKTQPLGRYWVPEGTTTGSGLSSGPGYRAHANDVPEGTRLVITARIELPEEQQ
jgi:hypothetical protein